ncbi:Phenylalanine--tRNA ligase beta subunit [Caloramator mitchellensis]|uniref:Phenylalanine--tRNA ligase beta subunit n=1 Tax=Caloramator mitchellensis TaxID=908809 RepID=A0A0R3K333_CALMK|nr:phenylalanine--tRNA ligase subunit beta [Caloramator mitchellensis]KRQ87346.1 Phenylalanine--tRNA ligase beta subunit [Caloramator mitchellensis]
MKVPYNWLLEYVDLDKGIKEVADALTMSGSKVEEVIEYGKEIDRVVTGYVEKITKHPDADKLRICQVNVGNETIQIVTGAENVQEGDTVPVALHGSTLPGGVKIKKGKLRGIESNGMLCSEAELGIAKDDSVHGIMILPKDTPLGVDIKEILGLNGGIIDFEITSNRADCFGVYGIAREASATFRKPLKAVETGFNENSENINDYLSVEVKDDLCRRYAARVVKNVKIGHSPEWMQQRLMDAGVRPINNIVDITNYVMLELGQPMHAFDYRFIEGKKIIVRRAEEGEKFTTLDGIERTLDDSMLVIADGAKAVAVAGVMGGQNSEIQEDTSTIVFECANFNGTNVRLTAKKLGLRTESSSRFEKDLDPNIIDAALDRACHLIETLGIGEVVGGKIDIYPQKLEPYYMEVSSKWINDFIGINISAEDMKNMLKYLGMKVEGDEILKIEVPTFRQDVKIKEDVAEEIARLYGYDTIPTVKIKGEAVEAAYTKEQKLVNLIRNTMVSSGFFETNTYSFVSPKVFDRVKLKENSPLRNAVKILNPLGEDFSVMRTTLIPSLLGTLEVNNARDNKEVRIFEVAKTYHPTDDKLPNEPVRLGIAMMGKADFYDLKGVVENIINLLGIDKVDFERDEQNPTFHPGRCARLLVRRKDAGVFGEIHPEVAEEYGIEDRVYAAEIDLMALFEAAKFERKYKPLPKYPAIDRDMAVLVKDDIAVAEIENIIWKIGKGLVEEVKLFDVYKGKQVPDGYKSVAYSIIFRLEDRTLTDDEINPVFNKIVETLSNKLGAQLR